MERDYEKEALADGWNPDFEGPGKKDAKTFVEDGEKINGMLKSKIGHLEERINSLTETNAEFKKFTDKQIKQEAAKNKSLIAELEKVKAQAITDGDGAAVIKAEKDIQDLQEPVKADDGREAYDRMANKWASENQWYANNKKLSAFANGIVDDIVAQGYTGQAYFNELTRQVKETFPEEFENPNRKKDGVVEDGSPKVVSKGKGWANLPAEHKQQAERFMKDIPGFTKEDYLAQYEWESE